MLPSNLKLLGASVLIFIMMGVGLYWQHTKISSQALTIDSMTSQIESLEKKAKARDKVAVTYKQDIAKATRERDDYKRKLRDAEAGNSCSDNVLSDSTQRVLKELYSSQPSF